MALVAIVVLAGCAAGTPRATRATATAKAATCPSPQPIPFPPEAMGVGPIEDAKLPDYFYIDYVRVYAYVPPR
jgi:hypothetical protein